MNRIQCPNCKSTNLSTTEDEPDDDGYIEYQCDECGEVFTDEEM